ncbi:hypothetical protein ONZ51_g10903 [Trametes cubensis]|uniref:Uncharacterized protein n=1 Tax=Trametes cubensis TaxID=1111947 RepID=A0AAD7TJN0_9APHY|nr:hypothetical protein ONZ51_g10903 [Trametes cubensis]
MKLESALRNSRLRSNKKNIAAGNLTISEFMNSPTKRVRTVQRYPADGPLQGSGVTSSNTARNPGQHLDVHNEKRLHVVKNGSAFESFTCRYTGVSNGDHIRQTSIEIAVL